MPALRRAPTILADGDDLSHVADAVFNPLLPLANGLRLCGLPGDQPDRGDDRLAKQLLPVPVVDACSLLERQASVRRERPSLLQPIGHPPRGIFALLLVVIGGGQHDLVVSEEAALLEEEREPLTDVLL